MFENFRERLQVVQQDLSSGFKTLGEASRDGKARRRYRFEERLPHLRAGVEILSRYENSWFLLHKRSQENAQAAEAVDGDVVVLSAHWEKRRAALIQLQEQLHSLPDFISQFDAITAKIAHLEGDFEEMESRLVYLETLCCQCEQQTVKNQHINQMEIYKKKKRKEVELLEVELNLEHAQRVAELERAMQQKLRERQKVYEEAFHQDIEEYLSTGHLQHTEAVGADACVLEQMTVANVSDQEALDDFLNSTSDTSPGTSPTSGPDLRSSCSDSLNQDSPTNQDRSKEAAVWEQEEATSEESDAQLVQSDEEDVQPDTSLIGLRDVCAAGDSEDSEAEASPPHSEH
ncbi:dysbindin-A isoform X1 [Oryzias latipes]|uniref:Dystrobrevin binding protein 1b n=1 Tax=Oryzias latipes TaxID=8090 RepID=H2LFB1_ORYLA|nr:dysbindin-A isoform X1 [Oryzias latipes]